jgi:hypothetical protein
MAISRRDVLLGRVTRLNLGRTPSAGTPAGIRAHEEVVSATLGG